MISNQTKWRGVCSHSLWSNFRGPERENAVISIPRSNSDYFILMFFVLLYWRYAWQVISIATRRFQAFISNCVCRPIIGKVKPDNRSIYNAKREGKCKRIYKHFLRRRRETKINELARDSKKTLRNQNVFLYKFYSVERNVSSVLNQSITFSVDTELLPQLSQYEAVKVRLQLSLPEMLIC